jgi:hypothetical protein
MSQNAKSEAVRAIDEAMGYLEMSEYGLSAKEIAECVDVPECAVDGLLLLAGAPVLQLRAVAENWSRHRMIMEALRLFSDCLAGLNVALDGGRPWPAWQLN